MASSSQAASAFSNPAPLLPRLKAFPPALRGLTFPELFFHPRGQSKRGLSSAERLEIEKLTPDLRDLYLSDSGSSAPRRCFALLRAEELLFFAVTPERLVTLGSCSASTGDRSLFVSCNRPLIERLFPAPLWEEIAALDSSDELLIAEYSPMGALRSWVEVGKEETLLAPLIETFPELRGAADLNGRDSRRQTALHRAVLNGEVEAAIALIRAGAERDPKELDGKSPLHLAAAQGNLPMVEALLSLGCDPLALTSEQENLLHLAVSKESLSLTVFLLGHPAASTWLAQGDSDGKSPLHRAVWGDPKPELVGHLLRAGADPNRPSLYGYTPLHWAAKHGHFESGQLFLAAGARIDQLNANGETPIDLALRFDQGAMVWQLLGGESSQFLQATASSSAASSSSSPSASSSDPRGAFYADFEAAYDEGKLLPQIYWLEKLGELYIKQGEYLQAAHCLNGALSLVLSNPSDFDGRGEILKKLIFAQLEKIEGLLLWDLFQQKSPASHRGYLIRYREELDSIRRRFAERLNGGLAIEEAQELLTKSYRNLLIALIEESIELIDQGRPSGFAVMGLGSMARMEMCPYSDLEFAFLIEEPSPARLDYFRKLSQLLTLRMVNMGETHFTLVRFKRGRGEGEDRPEKSLVPTGFSLDIGGLCPSGKRGVYELIGTPDQLAQFQTVDWLNHNDSEIILVNALTLSSYLTGERGLVDLYQREVDSILNTNIGGRMPWSWKRLREERAFELMRGFVNEFEPRLDQDKTDLRAFDVKKELYRLPQTVVSGLALYYGLKGTNTLARIEELRKAKILSRSGANRLKAVFKSILKLRVEAHLFYRTEREILYHPRAEEVVEERLLTISPELGQQLLEIYRTLIPLHEGARAFLRGDPKALSRSPLYTSSIGTYDDRLRENLNYESALHAAHSTAAFNPDSSSQHSLGLVYLDIGQGEKGVKSLEEAYLLLKREHGDRPHSDVAGCLHNLGTAYRALGDIRRAIDYREQALGMFKLIYGDRPHLNITNVFISLAVAYMDLKENHRAIDYLQQSLTMVKQIHGDRPSPHVADILNNLGEAYRELGESRRAIDYYEQSLDMKKLIHGDRPHPVIATSLMNLGSGYLNLGEARRAADYYEQSLAMKKLIHGDRPHPDIATSLMNVGLAYQVLGEISRAIDCLEQSLAMKKQIHGGQPHPDVGDSLYNLAGAYYFLGNLPKVNELFLSAYEMFLETVGADHPRTKLAKWALDRAIAAKDPIEDSKS